MYKLKKGQEAITLVDGPDAGKTFEKDVEYEQAPVGYEKRFEAVKFHDPGPVKKSSKTAGGKK